MKRFYGGVLAAGVAVHAAVLEEDRKCENCATHSLGAGAPSQTSVASPLPALDEALKAFRGALVDQNGRAVDLYADLIEDRAVAAHFIFTTCQTVCPVMGVHFARVRQELARRAAENASLISISLDPVHDTPDRLKAWAERFQGGAADDGWTLLTGSKRDVDTLLKLFEVFTPDKNDHPPFVALRDKETGVWTKAHGFTPPATIVDRLTKNPPERRAGPSEPKQNAPTGLSYFTDVKLTDQDGNRLRLFSDLMQDKTVVVSSFFSDCQGVCPALLSKMKTLRDAMGARMERDVRFLSLTVDPLADSPEKMKRLAEKIDAGPGWYFLTGEERAVHQALRKFGQHVEVKEAHSNILIVGNLRTGLWKKIKGLADDQSLLDACLSVVNDAPDG